MDRLKNWWQTVRGKPTEQQAAERAVTEAQEGMQRVRDRVTEEVNALQRDQAILRQQLTRAVDSRATQSVLVDLTKQCQQLDNQIKEKQKLLNNLRRETTQLSDTGTNAQVAAAYMQSVEAQQNLTRFALNGSTMNDVLDRVADLREETRENTTELADMGGLDEDLLVDEDNFDAEAVMKAMGLRTDYKEDLMVREIKAKMQEHWQPEKPSDPIDIPPETLSLFSGDNKIGSKPTNDSTLRQRHVHTNTKQATQYQMPTPPTSHYAHAKEEEEAQCRAILQHALAPPKTEY